ncbi:hypothetical protein TSAR_011382 [Trichomalopsis sarcophagae]|uniref:Uncharacterized protein n=1 Tax=Trichomalopsis sarcophagae TaxID=543379 RepID=A0A232F4U5_9HYME|nr:hypothetical protein TSAR_011382 [Trichomalopsis sarcophagae]
MEKKLDTMTTMTRRAGTGRSKRGDSNGGGGGGGGRLGPRGNSGGGYDGSERRMVDITRDKPIKVAVRVQVPVRDHPKV